MNTAYFLLTIVVASAAPIYIIEKYHQKRNRNDAKQFLNKIFLYNPHAKDVLSNIKQEYPQGVLQIKDVVYESTNLYRIKSDVSVIGNTESYSYKLVDNAINTYKEIYVDNLKTFIKDGVFKEISEDELLLMKIE